jgi:adenylate cyclase
MNTPLNTRLEPFMVRRILMRTMVSLPAEEQWRMILDGTAPSLRTIRHVFRLLPTNPRCKFCNAPFRGMGGKIANMLGHGRSNMNPYWCRVCMETAPAGGAESELTLLFADIRGSTSLAEKISPSEYSRLINRFYEAATKVLVDSNGLIDKFVGDEVIGLYIPGFAGSNHAQLAIQAGRALLEATGHGDASGPWLPVGVGLHTGVAFVGKVGSSDVTDITALGDAVNTTARLASQAKAGEILISSAAYSASKLDLGELERRTLELKGRSVPIETHVLKVDAAKTVA